MQTDSMIIYKNKRVQCQNIWTKHLEDGMTTLVMTLDLGGEITKNSYNAVKVSKRVWTQI